MKDITLKSNSWHYWLATKIGSYKAWDADFCKYVRSVVFALFVLSFLSAIAVLILHTFITICIHAWRHQLTDKDAAFIAAVIIVGGVIAFIAAIVWLTNWRARRRLARVRALRAQGIFEEPESDSFMATVYRRFKDKVCFRVKFVSPEDTKAEQAPSDTEKMLDDVIAYLNKPKD